MKLKNEKTITRIFMIFSIVNIICVIVGYFTGVVGNHSFNESLSPSQNNISIFVILVLVLQIINIVLIFILIKKELTTKAKKIILILVLLIIIGTLFIPTKRISSIKYKYPTTNKNNNLSLDPSTLGSTTYMQSYKNLYGITLKNSYRTSVGMDIY